jgi:D-alanyl-D-alanine carboxypeptidase
MTDEFDMNSQHFRLANRCSIGGRRAPCMSGPDRPEPKRRIPLVLALATLVSVLTLTLNPIPAVASHVTGPGSTWVSGRVDLGIRALLTEVAATGVPGSVVRVQDGREIRVATAGVLDLATGAELGPGARFRVGSITKTFVATVVLQLVGEGRLSLDEPIARRLPGLLGNGNAITVRELLNHTSGLFDYTADPTVLAGIAQNRVFNPTELVGIAETHPSLVPPGASWGYSNTNYIVAGLLVEAVTHHRLGRELRHRIFDPLHLSATSFPVATGKIPGYHAHGYVPTELVPTADGRPFDVTELNPSAAWAAGAIISNAADLSRFYLALMNGTLITPHLLREMKTTVPEDPADTQQFRYGLGIERVQDPCGANWGHSGAIFGYQDMAYWNEQTGRTVVIADTMFPAPPAAEEALTNLADFALCGIHH